MSQKINELRSHKLSLFIVIWSTTIFSQMSSIVNVERFHHIQPKYSYREMKRSILCFLAITFFVVVFVWVFMILINTGKIQRSLLLERIQWTWMIIFSSTSLLPERLWQPSIHSVIDNTMVRGFPLVEERSDKVKKVSDILLANVNS